MKKFKIDQKGEFFIVYKRILNIYWRCHYWFRDWNSAYDYVMSQIKSNKEVKIVSNFENKEEYEKNFKPGE